MPDDNFAIQDSLFLPPGVAQTEGFPVIYEDYEGFEKVLYDPSVKEGLGLDLEFNSSTGKPSILGISNIHECAAVFWDADLARACVKRVQDLGVQIVGHAVISADRPILDGALKSETPLNLWCDTIISHYLCNPMLCKVPSKEDDDSDGGSTGASGYMALWPMASLYTDLPQWKRCRGKACEGPCPLHQPRQYCAVDAYAGLMAKFGTFAEMKDKGIPEQLHEDLSVLSEICYLMEKRGIKVDQEYVTTLEALFEEEKAKIFPVEKHGTKVIHTLFNPKSVTQVKAYFTQHKVALLDTDKKTISKVLEKQIKLAGLDQNWVLPSKDDRTIDEIIEVAAKLPEPVSSLYRLFKFKESGKGISAWFSDKFVHKDGLLHPRFIVPGTSMGRLSSSGPNLQNVPSRGFGKKVRQAVIPRDSTLEFLSADYSQLEMRIMLHYGGYDLKELTGDPFAGIVVRANGQFDTAAAFMHGKPRDVAKKLVHANSYGEGMVWLSKKDLERRKAEVEDGSLLVYEDWDYRGGVVGFTGANLAEFLYGNKTRKCRRDALALQELVNAEFPAIRRLHRKVTTQIEERRGIQLETGRFLPLFGSPDDDFKMGTAAIGQGAGADFVQSVMLRYWRELGVYPVLQIHDDLQWEISAGWTNAQCWDFLRIMREPTERMKGFWCPIKAKRGPSWGELKEFEV